MEKKSIASRGGSFVLWALILGMMAYTTSRTLHLLLTTFPDDQKYVAYLGLVAFDVGVLGWMFYSMHSAEGGWQRVIAYGMVFVCALGTIVATICDTLLGAQTNTRSIKLPVEMTTVTLWVVMIVITLNFVAGIAVHLVSPQNQMNFQLQNVKDGIKQAGIAAIAQRATQIQPQMAQRMADEWSEQVMRDMIGHIPTRTRVVEMGPASLAQTANVKKKPDVDTQTGK